MADWLKSEGKFDKVFLPDVAMAADANAALPCGCVGQCHAEMMPEIKSEVEERKEEYRHEAAVMFMVKQNAQAANGQQPNAPVTLLECQMATMRYHCYYGKRSLLSSPNAAAFTLRGRSEL